MSLVCENLSVSVAGLAVVDGLDLRLETGQFWGLLGPNGAGKTTLLNTLGGLRPPEAGNITLEGQDIQHISRNLIARRLGLLQQHTQYVFDASVMQMAVMGRHPYLKFWQQESKDDYLLAESALEKLDLLKLKDRSVTTLSGGEARRVALSTLLVQDSKYILLDEPTNHLDLHHQNLVMRLFNRMAQESGKAVLMVVHDVNLAAAWCDHLLMLFSNGEYLKGPAEKLLNPENLSRLYSTDIQCVDTPSGQRFFAGP